MILLKYVTSFLFFSRVCCEKILTTDEEVHGKSFDVKDLNKDTGGTKWKKAVEQKSHFRKISRIETAIKHGESEDKALVQLHRETTRACAKLNGGHKHSVRFERKSRVINRNRRTVDMCNARSQEVLKFALAAGIASATVFMGSAFFVAPIALSLIPAGVELATHLSCKGKGESEKIYLNSFVDLVRNIAKTEISNHALDIVAKHHQNLLNTLETTKYWHYYEYQDAVRRTVELEVVVSSLGVENAGLMFTYSVLKIQWLQNLADFSQSKGHIECLKEDINKLVYHADKTLDYSEAMKKKLHDYKKSIVFKQRWSKQNGWQLKCNFSYYYKYGNGSEETTVPEDGCGMTKKAKWDLHRKHNAILHAIKEEEFKKMENEIWTADVKKNLAKVTWIKNTALKRFQCSYWIYAGDNKCLALQGTVSQSCFDNANRAIDGNKFSSIYTCKMMNAWWKVDLLQEYSIRSIVVWGFVVHRDCYFGWWCSNKIYDNVNIEILRGNKVVNTRKVRYPAGKYKISFDYTPGTIGDTVRVQLTNTGYLKFAEVDVIGSPPNGEKVCENHGYDDIQCKHLRCCHYNYEYNECLSSVRNKECKI